MDRIATLEEIVIRRAERVIELEGRDD